MPFVNGIERAAKKADVHGIGLGIISAMAKRFQGFTFQGLKDCRVSSVTHRFTTHRRWNVETFETLKHSKHYSTAVGTFSSAVPARLTSSTFSAIAYFSFSTPSPVTA